MTTRKGPNPIDEELSGSAAPRLRRRSNGAEYVVSGEMLVGRGLECDIVISDGDSISRRHAQLSGNGDELFVTDLGSTNGTHLNGKEVTERTALADGDVLAFDEYAFDVVVPPPPPPEPVDPEATRLVDPAELRARIGHDPFASEAAEPASMPPVRIDAEAPPVQRDERPSWDSGSVVDEMADDEWTWPELDDDLDERMIELADGPSGLGDPLFGDDTGAPEAAPPTPPEPAPAAPTATDSAPAGPPPAEPPPAQPRSADPVPANRAPPAPASARPDQGAASSSGRAPDAPVRIDADATDDAPVAGGHRSRDERGPGNAGRGATPRDARPSAPATPSASGPVDAAVPGAWASATSLHANPEHTMIAKYVAPRPKMPPAIDTATLAGPALLVGTGDPAGQILALAGEQTSWIVGSGDDCDLQIRHEGVSTRHAVISREGSKWRLGDELSVNGTWVNGKRVNVGYVGDGDDLRFGPVECRLAIPAGSHRPPRAATARDAGARAPAWTDRLPTGPAAMAGLAVLVLVLVGLAVMALRG